MRGAPLVVVAGVVVVACATPHDKRDIDAAERAYLTQWTPVHREAATQQARKILECRDVTLRLLGGGRIVGDDGVDERLHTVWLGVGCGREGEWVAYCPPFPTLGNTSTAPAGKAVCEVKMRGVHEQTGPRTYAVSDVGAVVVVDAPESTAAPPATAYPDD